MEKLNNPSEFNLIIKYALKDLSRNYKKLSSIIITLFISLFILSAIFTIEDSLKNYQFHLALKFLMFDHLQVPNHQKQQSH